MGSPGRCQHGLGGGKVGERSFKPTFAPQLHARGENPISYSWISSPGFLLAQRGQVWVDTPILGC